MTKSYTFGNQPITGKAFTTLLSPREQRLQTKRKNGLTYDPVPDYRTTELLAMLRTMRPAGSQTERDFVDQWIAPLGTEPDAYGNHWKVIGDSRIMWSCHTDTVHKRSGTQYVGFTDGCAYVTRSNCLGADDTVGCWIMRNMIKAGVPGTYVFHRAEEIGGIGSHWVLDNTPERLSGLDFAIAFDRMGYHDIITSQMSDTASYEFADSLATALLPLQYDAADGIFTDTSVYADIIAECSNISVGYHNQHHSDEWLDVDYATALLDRILSGNFTRLVAARDPDARWNAYTSKYTISDDRWGAYDHASWWEREQDKLWADGEGAMVTSRATRYGSDRDRLVALCQENPEAVADFLELCGYSYDDLMAYLG